MEPFCIGSVCIELTLELGGVLIAIVGGIATWLNSRQQRANRAQRERHFQETQAASLTARAAASSGTG